MRDENPAIPRGEKKDFGIGNVVEIALSCAPKVDGGLALEDTYADGVPKIVVGLKAQSQSVVRSG